MKNFSLKPKVEPLDISVEGDQVFVRQLSTGDKVRLSESLGQIAAMAAQVRAKAADESAEGLAAQAERMMSPEQFQKFVDYQAEIVFLRWCNEDGTRRWKSREEFDELPADLVDAIYTESSKGEVDEAEAEGN